MALITTAAYRGNVHVWNNTLDFNDVCEWDMLLTRLVWSIMFISDEESLFYYLLLIQIGQFTAPVGA